MHANIYAVHSSYFYDMFAASAATFDVLFLLYVFAASAATFDSYVHVSCFYVCCVGRKQLLMSCVVFFITPLTSCRYPRACHLICLRVGAEAAKLASTDRGVSSGEALTPSKGKGRAMHGQRMVEWLEVRRRRVKHCTRSLTHERAACAAKLRVFVFLYSPF